MVATDAIADLAPYEQQAADLVTTTVSLEEARDKVARELGFRTWWRLVAAVDAALQGSTAQTGGRLDGAHIAVGHDLSARTAARVGQHPVTDLRLAR
jgi:hypothetical protein